MERKMLIQITVHKAIGWTDKQKNKFDTRPGIITFKLQSFYKPK